MDWSIDKAGRVLITVAGQIGSGKTARFRGRLAATRVGK